MAKNNKKKTKETKVIVENKEEIVDKKDVPTDEENSNLEEKKGLIQNVIPSKIMNMFFSSWWAISAALVLYLFFYAAAVHEEARYAMLNKVYSLSDMNLLVFYTENARLLFNFVWVLLTILVPGFYVCVGVCVFRNFLTVILLVCFLIIVISIAFYMKGTIDVYYIITALILAIIFMFFIRYLRAKLLEPLESSKADRTFIPEIVTGIIFGVVRILYKISGLQWLKEKLLELIPSERIKENILAVDLLMTQMVVVLYVIVVCIMVYTSVLFLFSTIAYNYGQEAGLIELNKRMEKSNTPINIEPKYFEIEIPTVSCNDSSCIKLGQQRIDSIE